MSVSSHRLQILQRCRVSFAKPWLAGHSPVTGRNLTVFGMGGKVRYLPEVDRELREALGRHILDRGPTPEEFLLYTEKLGPEFYGGPVGTIWEDRRKQLSSTAMHRWWSRCLERAGIAHRPMHEARHTAITAVLRRTGNLKLRRCSPAMPTSGPPQTSTPPGYVKPSRPRSRR
jgi:integrase